MINADGSAWAQALIEGQLDEALRALRTFCKDYTSAKRLHRARKSLARLRSALEDLGPASGVQTIDLYERVRALYRAAGKIRDADVLLDRLKTYKRTAGSDERLELKTVARALRKRRKKAQRKLRRALKAAVPEL